MKILIVEDEKSLQNSLAKGFRKLGYATHVASDGIEALDLISEYFYDAIILDLNMPHLDGIEVLKKIRESDKEIKVLILSAKSEVESKIEGLDKGANDFVAKPFHFSELEARLRALLRRKFVIEDAIIKVGSLTLDTTQKAVFYDKNRIDLTKKEYGIFEYLALNKGRIISTAELIEKIWEEDADYFLSSFKVHINSLKKKLAEFAPNIEIIKNKRGIGYYVEEEVA